ncbi:DNA repair RAD52-like protein 1, mitochondrial [Cynara cardunculus var. scolymus]|uniref:DNA repair RAD52-like protein 1, mitochondrial n=1 Tax=Cynara cardunculus var. scolymus TaxID=59895 RepID=UPI000D623506|nr:DNA repair RAD52-like protein 1, mitochondrial [Cynara cardunculus var. scolymus]
MAFCLMKSLSQKSTNSLSAALRLTSSELVGAKSALSAHGLLYSTKRAKKEEIIAAYEIPAPPPPLDDDIPTSGISRPISEILKELNKKVPDSLIRARTEANGFSIKYIPWHIVNRIMNLHAPEWSGEVRRIDYSADGKSVSVTYRVTIYGTDAEIFRESTGTSSIDEVGYGDPVQKAEAMAFRRACARFGLGLHLYHEEL